MKTYISGIRTAVEQRKRIRIPSFHKVIWFVSALIVIVIILALYIAPDNEIDFHFRKETGVITALSAIFLAIASGLAGCSFFLSDKKSRKQTIFWFLVMGAFLFLSMDEMMQFHERVGFWIDNNWLGPSQIFRNWNDAVVILYGMGAVVFFAYFFPVIMRYPKLVELLGSAFVFYIVHTGIDSLSVVKANINIIVEETCKVFSSGYFAIAMFVGLLGNIVIYNSGNENDMK